MSTRCKFTCSSKTITGAGEHKQHRFEFVPVTGQDNKEFWKYTPSGKLEFNCLNPNVDFETGKDYFIDIALAE